MKKLILICAFLVGWIIGVLVLLSHSEEVIKGNSKLCDDIGYLSTSCQNVNVLPYEYKDIDVAKEKAKQPITNNKTKVNVNNITNEAEQESKAKNNIVVKSWIEEE